MDEDVEDESQFVPIHKRMPYSSHVYNKDVELPNQKENVKIEGQTYGYSTHFGIWLEIYTTMHTWAGAILFEFNFLT